MNRLSTFPLPAAAPAAGGAPDGLCDEVPGGLPDPDLPPPQALNNNEHPSARIAIRRTLNIERIPFAVEGTSYIVAGVRGTGPLAEAGPQRQTFSSRCSRSQELMTCAKVSYSASLTAVKASTKRSPNTSTSGFDSRSRRSASANVRGNAIARS